MAEQEKQATEVHSQYKGALGRLLREAVDPKTGKGIPAATITALEQSLDLKEHAADTARLRVIQLRTKLLQMHKMEHEVGTLFFFNCKHYKLIIDHSGNTEPVLTLFSCEEKARNPELFWNFLQDGTKPNLHLVDFEHLKMENATLLDKIEARGKQLLESQQQAQAAVRVRHTLTDLPDMGQMPRSCRIPCFGSSIMFL